MWGKNFILLNRKMTVSSFRLHCNICKTLTRHFTKISRLKTTLLKQFCLLETVPLQVTTTAVLLSQQVPSIIGLKHHSTKPFV